jgi:hypothetical protein
MSFTAESLLGTTHQRLQQPLDIVLLGTWGCHLCDDAASVLQMALAHPHVAAAIGRIAGRATTIEYQQLDIVDDPDLFAQYRYRIPVMRLFKISDNRMDSHKPYLVDEASPPAMTLPAPHRELCWPFQVDDVVQALLALLQPCEIYQSHHANHCE